MIRKIVIFILFFAFFYDMKISEPFLTTRFFMGLIGAGLFFVDSMQNRISFKKKYLNIIFVYLLPLLWSFFSCFYNGTNEYQFLYEFKFLIIIFFATYFLIVISRSVINSISQLFDLIILMVVGQCLIAVLATVSSTVGSFVLANANAIESFIAREQGTRLIGIGSAVFFGILPTSSLALFACVYQIFYSSRRNKALYAISFFIIFIISYLMARTIIFAAIPAGFIYFVYSRNSGQQIGRILLILLPIALLFVFWEFAGTLLSGEMYNWAFNSFSRDSENTTVNEVYQWYAFTQFNTKTWWVGDGLMSAKGGGYYMGMDAGYIRTIFYVGIIGLFLYFYYQFYMAKTIYRTTNNKYLWYFLLAYLFYYTIMMVKGYVSISRELLFLLVMIDYGKLRINNYYLTK